ncbi:DUF6261 family protein [Flavobacterium sp. SM2513]|uniref:DUF6261 family protein n=1 Tax=Flavobacterium sp. SM2513 TaxID=3424766 RepID=UPI003D7F1E59
MIYGLNLRLLRNAELLQFIDYIIKAVERNNPTALHLDAKLMALKVLYDQIDALFKLPQDSLLTEDLQNFDIQRDRAITGIYKALDAFSYHFDIHFTDAAKLLDRNLTMYGPEIYKMNYQAESTTITNIIKDWDTETDLKDAVTLLGLSDWKDELDSSNRNFIARYDDRNQEYSAESLDKIKEKRIELYAAYYKLRDLITSYATIDESNPGYQQLIREFNNYIDSNNTLLAGRKGKKEEE